MHGPVAARRADAGAIRFTPLKEKEDQMKKLMMTAAAAALMTSTGFVSAMATDQMQNSPMPRPESMPAATPAPKPGAGPAAMPSPSSQSQEMVPNNDSAARSYNSTAANGTAGTNESIAAIDLNTVADSERASKIIGNDVVGSDNQTLGSIDDLLIKDESGKNALYAVLSVGGFLGIGNKDVVVPYRSLQIAKDKVVLPGVTKESLEALPNYDHNG